MSRPPEGTKIGIGTVEKCYRVEHVMAKSYGSYGLRVSRDFGGWKWRNRTRETEAVRIVKGSKDGGAASCREGERCLVTRPATGIPGTGPRTVLLMIYRRPWSCF